jgi:hypothetical protein
MDDELLHAKRCIELGNYRMRPPANSSKRRDRGNVVGKTSTSDTYHFLTNNKSKSLCRTLDDEEFLGPDVALTLTETEAEQQGFALCDHCARLADI